jgi:hypothetical protein
MSRKLGYRDRAALTLALSVFVVGIWAVNDKIVFHDGMAANSETQPKPGFVAFTEHIVISDHAICEKYLRAIAVSISILVLDGFKVPIIPHRGDEITCHGLICYKWISFVDNKPAIVWMLGQLVNRFYNQHLPDSFAQKSGSLAAILEFPLKAMGNRIIVAFTPTNGVFPYRNQKRSLRVSYSPDLGAEVDQSTNCSDGDNSIDYDAPPLRVAPLWLGWLMFVVGVMVGGYGLSRVLDGGRWVYLLLLCCGLAIDLMGLGIVVMGRQCPRRNIKIKILNIGVRLYETRIPRRPEGVRELQ